MPPHAQACCISHAATGEADAVLPLASVPGRALALGAELSRELREEAHSAEAAMAAKLWWIPRQAAAE